MLNYYVLWTKNSPLLKEYFDKYYNKLIKDLENIQKEYSFIKLNELLKQKDQKKFILDADISSLIQSITIEDDKNSLNNLKDEIDIFLNEWINSSHLTMNKWKKIAWTNIKLTDTDNNPYSNLEAHPHHKQSWAVSWNWGEKKEQEWLDSYEKTFHLLKQLDEWIYEELNQIITKIIPLGTAKWMHNSASYKECIGHLYMWYTIDSSTPEINNLEAIIHESSHNKLNLIKQFDPLLENDYTEKYYSAIRPDARHIHWVFLWYHAFAPTMYIIMKSYKKWYLWNWWMWLDKIVLYYIKTKFLQKIVKKYWRLTKIWKDISSEIDYVISLMDKLFKEINPSKEVILKAKEQQKIHFNEVNKNYPHLEY